MTVLDAIRRCGLCYHPDVPGADELSDRLRERVRAYGIGSWIAALERDGEDGGVVAKETLDSDLVVCVGGDGAVLQASGIAAPCEVPVFGVRMGRLGFLAESTATEAEAALQMILDGEGRIEERTMVQATISDDEPMHALNEIVIGRHRLGRTVSVGLHVDGMLIAEYRADAIIVATATGSTGYALAINGPILYPTSSSLIVAAVAPHLSYGNALVLRDDVTVALEVARGFEAVLTADGRDERQVQSGNVVRVTRSPRIARFVRLGDESQFYANLAQRLGWLRRDHELGELQREGGA